MKQKRALTDRSSPCRIELSQKEFGLLVQMACLGHYVLTGNKEARGEKYAAEDALEQKLLGLAVEHGLSGMEHDREIGPTYTTAYEDQKITSEIDEFETEAAWYHLSLWLAYRDLALQYTHEQLGSMSRAERFILIPRFTPSYE